MGAERTLLRTEGLPGRPWFRHQLFAPGKYTGYDVKTIPGVREAIEQHNWEEANREIELVARTIEKLVGVIEQASAVLKPEKVK
jgi:N-acetylated-alpha-linked acidic dipeptidase